MSRQHCHSLSRSQSIILPIVMNYTTGDKLYTIFLEEEPPPSLFCNIITILWFRLFMLLYVGAFTVHLGQLVRVGWWGWCLPPTYSRENLFFVMLALCAAELWARQCPGLEVSKRAGLPPSSANACEGEPLPDRSALVISALGSREEAKQGRQVLGNWPHWKYPKGCPEASEWGTIFRIRQETVTLVLIFTIFFYFFFFFSLFTLFPSLFTRWNSPAFRSSRTADTHIYLLEHSRHGNRESQEDTVHRPATGHPLGPGGSGTGNTRARNSNSGWEKVDIFCVV